MIVDQFFKEELEHLEEPPPEAKRRLMRRFTRFMALWTKLGLPVELIGPMSRRYVEEMSPKEFTKRS